MKPDEMTLLKAISIKINPTTLLILSYQYHTEKGDKSKSRYRWIGTIDTIDNLNKLANELMSDNNRLNKWSWKNDPSWNGYIYIGGSNSSETDGTNARYSKWIKDKISKAVDWDEGIKLLNGFDKKKNIFNKNKIYDTANFNVTNSIEKINLTDKNILLNFVGQTIYKEKIKIPIVPDDMPD